MNKKAEKICPFCGKEFIGNNASVYCSKKCRYEAAKARRNRVKVFTCDYCGVKFLSERRKKYCGAICRDKANGKKSIRKKAKPKMSIEQVSKLSREAGLTYGQYVAKMGL